MTTLNKPADQSDFSKSPNIVMVAPGQGEHSEKSESSGGSPPPAGPKKRVLLIVIFLIAIVAIGAGLISWLLTRDYESTDDAFIDGHNIVISPKVSAIVRTVNIDDNSFVKKGEVLLELDPRDFQAALLQAQGNVEAAQGKLHEAQADVQVGKANVVQAEAELAVAQTNADNANDTYHRWLALDERARSKEQLDDASAAQKSTAAQVLSAKAKVTSAQAQVIETQMAEQTADGNLQASEGALDQAKNNLGYCTITAREDGIITRKSVEPGMLVQMDQALFSIIPTDVWVTANFKETQLNNIQPGQDVEIAVDAYPGRTLHGKVQSVQNGTGSRFSLLPPENATGNYVKVVQRIPVKITLNDGENSDMNHLLVPGMSVEPKVKVR